MRPLKVRGASLIEAVVASVILLAVFAVTMELLPRLSVRDDEGLRMAQGRYRLACILRKYASGAWPEGEYVETSEGVEAAIRIERYGGYEDLQLLVVEVRIDGCRRRLEHRQIVPCVP